MFETLSHFALQQYWWVIISLLASLLVFLFFVQGGQTLIFTLGKNELERAMLIGSLGHKWGLTFTTLVTFGGAFFASFPLFYSTSFGGAYWVWMIILFAFIIQAVAYEFRTKPNNFLGQRTYEAFLIINGAVGTILIGTAVGTFFTGSAFTVEKINLTNVLLGGPTTISVWKGPAYGLEAALNVQNLSLGLAVFFLARVLGILYFMTSVDDENIFMRSRKQLLINSAPFLVFFLLFLVLLLTSSGFAVIPDSVQNPMYWRIEMEPYKYLYNFLQMPVVFVLFLAGVVLVLFGIVISLVKVGNTKGIWPSGIGTVLTVFSLFMVAGLNNTSYYPSTYDLQSSLTIMNSSSSKFTLTAMSYVSLMVPFVAAYIAYAWRALNRQKVTEAEIKSGDHAY
ncbi:MAG: cytochrome d ubiquinol oxidase subunit II [Bacteroidales bacterium]|jgi:cytochrome d ubiquinol oxidase subunit II|nr:cytochrome d ubiquinol oxidase subunit II [Bacteroidales bacterium]MDI9593227.1 cytochrome d ubiquinol oxidase subunit II [Bacteroidota bacterium]HOF80712.1 cytochrome d ubiquinol oxidase subunit II [Bacteroidales bacterium]HOR76056.1 cytochrome d ubiquinol oxidase subunit II [Bacteroidales bacterium]HPL11464.1 cytochrome d ubiquinol oxidase subunit II [Bacteroidales bacterium]